MPEESSAAPSPAKQSETAAWHCQAGRCHARRPAAMKELLRTNDIVRLSWAQALLREAGIDSLVLDHHASLVEGNIGAIPRRLMVVDRDHGRARTLLAAAETELRSP
jgi:hypothetical protein